MTKRDVSQYKNFEDWFLANIDAGSLHTLRHYGASAGIGGLCHYRDTIALFNAFEDEIERLATDEHNIGIWQIARRCEARGVTQLKNRLVWIAAERLAVTLKVEGDAGHD